MLCRNLGFFFGLIGLFVNGELHLMQSFSPLVMYSQKAILKIKNPKIKCLFETFNS